MFKKILSYIILALYYFKFVSFRKINMQKYSADRTRNYSLIQFKYRAVYFYATNYNIYIDKNKKIYNTFL